MEWLRAISIEWDKELELRTGLQSGHRTGPYQRTSRSGRWCHDMDRRQELHIMELAIILSVIAVFELAALRLGADTRDGFGGRNR